jgi:hypothetical protein
VLVEAKASAFETSAKPAIVKNRLPVTSSTSLPVIFRIFFTMLISFSPVECPRHAATGNA